MDIINTQKKDAITAYNKANYKEKALLENIFGKDLFNKTTMITEQEVVSSQFKKVRYDSEEKTLIITFNNNKRYEYSGMSAEQFKEFMSADSFGKYFISKIKGHFNFRPL